ncbi:MAG: NAD(P)H-dependent oxidoreductase [Bacteroidota bacterium]
MQILTISGSARPNSSNIRLLKALPEFLPAANFQHYDGLEQLPLFTAEAKPNQAVKDWQAAVEQANAAVICTPEYINSIPALLKNALEWLVDSGEFYNKRVLVVTFTPHLPRGEKAMESLIWLLQVLKANIVGQLSLYTSEINFTKKKIEMKDKLKKIVRASLNTLL